jgi:hypothetical protein
MRDQLIQFDRLGDGAHIHRTRDLGYGLDDNLTRRLIDSGVDELTIDLHELHGQAAQI